MIIRKAKKTDFEEYYLLRTNATKEYSKIIKLKIPIETFKQVKKDFNKYISSKNLILLVFIEGDKVVAYLNGTMGKKNATIDYLFVDKKSRKKGVAEALIKEFFNILKNKKIKSCKLRVNIKNEIAIKCYEKLGFVVTNYIMNKEVKL